MYQNRCLALRYIILQTARFINLFKINAVPAIAFIFFIRGIYIQNMKYLVLIHMHQESLATVPILSTITPPTPRIELRRMVKVDQPMAGGSVLLLAATVVPFVVSSATASRIAPALAMLFPWHLSLRSRILIT